MQLDVQKTERLQIIRKIYNTNFSDLTTINYFNLSSKKTYYETIKINELEFKKIDLSTDNYSLSVYKIENLLFSGQTLQAGSVGYIKNYPTRKKLCNAIEEKLLGLPDSTLVLPFSGPPSSIKIERQFNVNFLNTN